MMQGKAVHGNYLSKNGYNGNQLKLIAVAGMLLDHIGVILIGCGILPGMMAEQAAEHKEYASWYLIYCLLRIVGRVAFPIYAFLLTEGFFHTRDWKKYAARLGIFALISEIPFDLMVWQKPMDMRTQNVFFTLLLGLLMLKALEAAERRWPAKSFTASEMVPQFSVVCVFCLLAWGLRSDYDYTGIILIAMFYWLRYNWQRMCCLGLVWMTIMMGNLFYVPGLALAFWLIYRYDGTRGSEKGKYAFYWIYPVHMLVLYGIYRFMF